MIIKSIKARKILNSRKEATIEIEVKSGEGYAKASAPSGASKSSKEVVAFPDNNVDKAIEFVNNTLAKELENYSLKNFDDFYDLENEIIKKYDPTSRLEKIGGNTVIALEFALLHALAKGRIWYFINPNAKSLPRPLGNCIGGGKHVNKENAPEFQEFLLISLDARSFDRAANANATIHKMLKKKLKKFLTKPKLTDEGAWCPELKTEEILDILQETIKEYKEKSKVDFDVRIGIDVAANSFFKNGKYFYKDKTLSRNEHISYLIDLAKKYKLTYLEDPVEENDFSGYAKIKKELVQGRTCLICGDDLTATNPELIKKAVQMKAINSVIIKPNQVGFLTKTIEAIEVAKKFGLNAVISHRSGETLDATISQLAVAYSLPIIKCGIFGKEREAKIKELLRIGKEIKALRQS